MSMDRPKNGDGKRLVVKLPEQRDEISARNLRRLERRGVVLKPEMKDARG
jgi:hypothetical protein